ncbi:hypothetical protein [Rhizobium leguminosarum]|uniref:hypothetical protein n=1 Tax=Rhizobium leguminosarum TaxID=384 RepID=UPI000422CDA1|nr:hypothetical protein [Rhizobium leguminosarum]
MTAIEQNTSTNTGAVDEHLRWLIRSDDGQLINLWHQRLRAGSTVEQLVTQRLLSKNFRGSSLDSLVAQRVLAVVSHAIREDVPLRLFIPFGGYKSPASREYPEASWAEVFAIAGMCELISPICRIHAPGVVIEFSSDEAVVPLFMGADEAVLNRYRSRFDHILSVVAAGQHRNLKLKQSLLRDDYDIDGLSRRIRELGKALESRWFSNLSSDEKTRLLGAAERNCFAALPMDLEDRMRVLTRSVCQHQAYLEIDNVERGTILFAPTTIPIALRRGLDGWLHLGSNRRSAVQFWIGAGVLDRRRTGMRAHILPPKRYLSLAPKSIGVSRSIINLTGMEQIPVMDAAIAAED